MHLLWASEQMTREFPSNEISDGGDVCFSLGTSVIIWASWLNSSLCCSSCCRSLVTCALLSLPSGVFIWRSTTITNVLPTFLSVGIHFRLNLCEIIRELPACQLDLSELLALMIIFLWIFAHLHNEFDNLLWFLRLLLRAVFCFVIKNLVSFVGFINMFMFSYPTKEATHCSNLTWYNGQVTSSVCLSLHAV